MDFTLPEELSIFQQTHGGIGLTTDLPVERFWRNQRPYLITEGAAEIMRMTVARHVLKTY